MRETWFSKENRCALLIAAICAYLSLFNLGYAPLWDDEPHMASIAENLLDSGNYTVWDGRNLMGAEDGRAVNQDLVAVSYPPWQATSTLIGIALFGYNETGVRFFHALLGVASLFAFWQLLRLDFASRPRLRVIAFALFALSAQSILFFRQGRYAADAIFFSLFLIYTYRLYIGPSGKTWHLACATALALLNFFNQFFIGVNTLLAIALWHLMFHWRSTTRKQWVSFMIAGAVFTALSMGYLWFAGIFENRADLNLGNLEFKHPWPQRGFVLAKIHFLDIVTNNWMPIWITAWLLGWISWIVAKRWRTSQPANPEDKAIVRYLALFVLIIGFSAFINVQAPSIYPFANSRYLVAALPFSFLLIAACVDWVWRHSGAFLALPLLAALMLSNLIGQPILKRELRLTLPSLVQEIHSPFQNAIVEVTEYLDAYAMQDDLVKVEPWSQRDVLTFYLSDKLRFCCMIDEDKTPLPPETVLELGKHLYSGGARPKWVVGFSRMFDDPQYELVFSSRSYGYASHHRPALEIHSFYFVPQIANNRAYIYKLIKDI